MNELLSQARSTLNVILVGVVALGWAVFQEPVPVFDLARTAIVNAAMFSTKNTMERGGGREPLPEIKEFMARLANALNVNHRDKVLFPDEALRTVGIAVFAPLVNIKRRPYPEVDVGEESAIDDMSQAASSLLQLAKDADVGDFATLGDLDDRSRRTLVLPVLGERVNADRAKGLISVGLIAPLLYLLSLAAAMHEQVRKDPSSLPISFLPFHPRKLGQVLTHVWLLAPAVLAWVGGLFMTKSAVLRYAAGPLTFIALLVIGRLVTIRHHAAPESEAGSRPVRLARYFAFAHQKTYWALAGGILAVVAVKTDDLQPVASVMVALYVLSWLAGEAYGALGCVGSLAVVVVLLAGSRALWHVGRERRRKRDVASKAV